MSSRRICALPFSTAHAAKFPDAVKRATGRNPDVPERLQAKLGQEERLTVLPNDYGKVAGFVAAHARQGRGSGGVQPKLRSGAKA